MLASELIKELQKHPDMHVYVPRMPKNCPEYQIVSRVDIEDLGSIDDPDSEVPTLVIE